MRVFFDFKLLPDGRIVDLRPLDCGYSPKIIDPSQSKEGWKPFKGELNKVFNFKPISEKQAEYLILHGIREPYEE